MGEDPIAKLRGLGRRWRIQDLRAFTKTSYDGISPEVFENIEPRCPKSNLRSHEHHRLYARRHDIFTEAFQRRTFWLLSPVTCLRQRKNEGDSGNVDENKGS